MPGRVRFVDDFDAGLCVEVADARTEAAPVDDQVAVDDTVFHGPVVVYPRWNRARTNGLAPPWWQAHPRLEYFGHISEEVRNGNHDEDDRHLDNGNCRQGRRESVFQILEDHHRNRRFSARPNEK